MTDDGTNHFKNLNDNDKKDFIEQLRIQIAKSIPVDESRLTYSKYFYKYKIDLVYITFKIDSPKENYFNQKSAKDVFVDFDKLLAVDDSVKTSLDINNSNTNYIDKKYGFEKASKYYLV